MTKLNELKIDIFLLPRKDNYFNRYKSNLKFLEASMVEAMYISQGFLDNQSPYEQNEEDTKYQVIIKIIKSGYDIIDYYVRNRKRKKRDSFKS